MIFLFNDDILLYLLFIYYLEMIPRKSGHCKFHYVPKHIVNPYNIPYDESQKDIYEKEYYKALQEGLIYLKLNEVI